MNNRQSAILRTLINQKHYIAGKELASIFGVSTKTIYSDVNKLNEFLANHQIHIVKSPRRGLLLACNEQQLSFLQSMLTQLQLNDTNDLASPESREKYLVQQFFLKNLCVDILDFAEEMFISEGSARRDIEKFEQQLSNYELATRRVNGKLVVEGPEFTQRKFIRDYVSEKILREDTDVHEWLESFFDVIDLDLSESAIHELANKYCHQFSEQYFNLLLLDILIQTCRIQRHQIIETEQHALVVDIHHLEVYFLAMELIEKVLKIQIETIPASEVEALSYSLLAVGFKINSPHYNQKLAKNVDKLIEKVSELLGLDLTRDEHLRVMLINHISPMVFRLRNTTKIYNPIIEEIKKRYSALYNIVWLSTRELADEFGVKLTGVEAAFLTIHFQIAVEKIRKPLNILVVCPNSLATSELILSRLKRVFSAADHIVKTNLASLKHKNIDNIDFIVSSIKIPELSKPCIEVSSIITEQELQDIQRFYGELTASGPILMRATEEEKTVENTLLVELLNQQVTLKYPAKNKQECLDYLLSQANPINLKNPEFAKSVFAREEMGSTSVYTGVALPHCDPVHVEHSQIIILTVDKPIEWGKNLVKVVILIAIAERDIDVLKDALINLYTRIEDVHFIEELWNAPSVSTFCNRLIGRGEE